MFKFFALPMILGVALLQCTETKPYFRNSPKNAATPNNAGIVQATASTSSKSATNNLPACVQKDCNCSDFQHQKDAQTVLEAFPNDPFKLDRNKDGVACEGLPK
jgi:hypothetical protein